MLLTITTTHRPATDLGYLLVKHPQKVQEYELAFGKAHVFYPTVTEERCTAALLVEIEPMKLVRGAGAVLTDYVNDRPYAATSLLSAAIAKVLGSALSGRCKDRPELVTTAMPLEAKITAVPCRPNDESITRLFEPLGYQVETTAGPTTSKDYGYRNVTLRATTSVRELLTHIYVLASVFDSRKHYWVGDAEVENILAKGKGWLEDHPERNRIVHRFLGHRRNLANTAISQLKEKETPAVNDEVQGENEPIDAEKANEAKAAARKGEKRKTLHEQRIEAVVATLKANGSNRVVDLGCGEGVLIHALLKDPQFQEIVGVDVSTQRLTVAERKLKLKRAPEAVRKRVRLFQSALTYRDRRLKGYDACCAVEVIEHIEPERIRAFEDAIFTAARPQLVVVTTPNREYNANYEGLTKNQLRHGDHRFEWTREEFNAWAADAAERNGYTVEISGVGEPDPEYGSSSQMGVFKRCN